MLRDAGGTGAGGGARQAAVVDVHAKPAQTSLAGAVAKGVAKGGDEAFPETFSRACAIVDFRDLAKQVLEAVAKSGVVVVGKGGP